MGPRWELSTNFHIDATFGVFVSLLLFITYLGIGKLYIDIHFLTTSLTTLRGSDTAFYF